MAETHLFQHLVAFVVAAWFTKHWLVSRPVSRWRFAVTALVSAIMWVFVAYTAVGSVYSENGVLTTYESFALAYIGAFMAFVSVVGILLGLLLWTEEETEKAGKGAPASARSSLGD